MKLNIITPYYLLIFPILLILIVFISKKIKRLSKTKKIIIIINRIALAFLLCLALSGVNIVSNSNEIMTIIAVDSSQSMQRYSSEVTAFIEDTLKNKPNNRSLGIVNFGHTGAIEFLPTKTPYFDSLQTTIDKSFTNIEQGLNTAESVMPSDIGKHIILITDGNENEGNAISKVDYLKNKGFVVDIYPIINNVDKEVQLKSIKTPETVNLNESFEIEVQIQSTVKTNATLKLYANNKLSNSIEISLNEGNNKYIFSDKAIDEGIMTYSVEIDPDIDSTLKNNKLSSITDVKDTQRILVIEGDDNGAHELIKILENDVSLDILSPSQVPSSMEMLLKYDGFIMSNISIDDLNQSFLDNIETLVKNNGKGLLVTGGESSYALGGYQDTVLEKILPVRMEIKPKKEIPNLGLILVIDKSGSMTSGEYGVSKLELAKEAAIRATEVLKKDDKIGVIAFDSDAQWVVRPKNLDNLKSIQDDIGTIRPGGGTSILPSLKEAYNALKNQDTKLKHIILLTDGQAERDGYEPLIESLRDSNITLSTVAVGKSSDSLLLKTLAVGGKGRYYYTDEFTDIPKIFAKEAFLAGKKYLNNHQFTPLQGSYHTIINNIDSVPILSGYVTTTPKETSTTILQSDENDPILSAWQYGLGRTVAWTSDIKGMWTQSWLAWENSPTFWKNIVSWIVQENMDEKLILDTSYSDGQININVSSNELNSFSKGSQVTIVDPKGESKALPLEMITPIEYTATYPAGEEGVYIISASLKDANDITHNSSRGFILPYSPEYNIPNKDALNLMIEMAKAGGGVIISDPKDAFKSNIEISKKSNDLTYLFLFLALILLLIDITVRRLSFDYEKAFNLARAFINRIIRKLLVQIKQSFMIKRDTIISTENTTRNEAINSIEKTDIKNKSKPVKNGKKSISKNKSQEDTNNNISVLLERKKKREGQ